MKLLTVTIAIFGVFILSGCDSQETKVKKLLKCGFAVDQIGSSLAKENYDKNGITIFGNIPPNISSYEMIRIGQDARDELWMNGRNHRGEVIKLIEEYEESYCVDMHRVPEDENIEKLKAMVNF